MYIYIYTYIYSHMLILFPFPSDCWRSLGNVAAVHRHQHLEGAGQCDLRLVCPLFEALRRCVEIMLSNLNI